jgi:chromosome segregation ATPase
MGNEKYLNYYIETLTSTMTDCVIRNVSMQANAKITDEVVKEQTEKIDALVKLNSELQETIQNLKQTNITNENNAIQDLKNKLAESENLVAKQKQDYEELTTKFRDYDSVKNQATHVETFKSELIRAREETNKVRTELENRINSINAETNGKISGINEENEKNVKLLIQKHETEKSNLNNQISELIEKIEYLQLPPAKRKKIDELNKEVVPTTITGLIGTNGPIKDGGTF